MLPTYKREVIIHVHLFTYFEQSNYSINLKQTEGKGEKRILLSTLYSNSVFVLQGQADLLKYAKNEALENLKQIHYATLSCGLNKPGTENTEISKPRRSLEVIPEKAGDENGE